MLRHMNRDSWAWRQTGHRESAATRCNAFSRAQRDEVVVVVGDHAFGATRGRESDADTNAAATRQQVVWWGAGGLRVEDGTWAPV